MNKLTIEIQNKIHGIYALRLKCFDGYLRKIRKFKKEYRCLIYKING